MKPYTSEIIFIYSTLCCAPLLVLVGGIAGVRYLRRSKQKKRSAKQAASHPQSFSAPEAERMSQQALQPAAAETRLPEPVQSPAQESHTLRKVASVLAGLLAGVLNIAFFLFVAGAVFVYLVKVGGEAGIALGSLGDTLCVAPVALIFLIPVVVFGGKLAHKGLTRIALTRGSRAEEKVIFSFFGIVGASAILVTLAFIAWGVGLQ